MRSSLRTTLAAVVAALAVTLVPAATQAQGLYIGGAYSWATLGVDHDELSVDIFDDIASGYRVFAGYEFGSFLGLEAGYVNFGSYDSRSLEGFDEGPAEAASDGWTAALTGRIPLGDILTAYGKVGYFAWDSEVTGTEDFLDQWGDSVRSGEDPFYGLGIRLNFDKLSILLEYEKYPSDQFDFDLVNAGIRFTF